MTTTPPVQTTIDSLSFHSFPEKWNFISNQPNIMLLIANGLFLDYRDFEKYQSDFLRLTPGYVALFNENLSQEELKQVLPKDHHFPVVMRVSLTGFQGKVHAICDDGSEMDIELPCQGTPRPIRILFVPAGLSTATAKSLIFKSQADMDNFIPLANNFGNVPIDDLGKEISEHLFIPKNQEIDRNAISRSIPQYDHDAHIHHIVQGIGGAMAMIYQLAQCNVTAARLYDRLIHQSNTLTITNKEDKILSHMPVYINEMTPYPEKEIPSRIFWDIFQHMAESNKKEDELQYDVLEILKRFTEDENIESTLQKRLFTLYQDIEQLKGFGAQKLSTLFQNHRGPFSRALICLYQYKTCTDFLESLKTLPDLDDSSLLVAAILFGVREKWNRLPNKLRGSEHFRRFISTHMMNLTYKRYGHDLKLIKPPISPMPIAALLVPEKLPSGKQLDKKQLKKPNDIRLDLARKQKWDCINTSVSLSTGDYSMDIKSTGVTIRFRGDVKCFDTEIDLDAFCAELRNMPIPWDEKGEKKIRADLDDSVSNIGDNRKKNKSKLS